VNAFVAAAVRGFCSGALPATLLGAAIAAVSNEAVPTAAFFAAAVFTGDVLVIAVEGKVVVRRMHHAALRLLQFEMAAL
jgi:hypothetical protein